MGKKMKKVDLAKKLISNNNHLFICPVCGKEMNIDDSTSLTCVNRHNFDLSRQGYINMVLNGKKTKYDKEMLESRKAISKSGFFDQMLQEVSKLILKEASIRNLQNSFILDAGCGEGSHLSRILTKMQNKTDISFQGVGIDISKEGIRIAARDYMNIIWCVADLTNMPFKNKQFDIVLNILSPSNYAEFYRILKDNGTLIKVVPGSNYLTELRNIFYDKTDKETYSNEKVIKLFTENFKMIENRRLFYEVALQEEETRHLLRMTPLTWNVEQETIAKVIKTGIKKVTADFHIIVGKK